MPAARRRPLSSEVIVREALGLVDRAGVDGFSMRALAQRLGTYPATLYWHVGNRNDVLSAVLELVLDEAEVPDASSMPWQAWVATWSREYRRVLHAHPNVALWAASVVFSRVTAPTTVEQLLHTLEQAGFAGSQLADAYNALLGSVAGWVATELMPVQPDLDPEWRTRYEADIRALPADGFPTITANMDVLAGNVIGLRWESGAARPLDSSFEFALRLWIAGLEALDPTAKES